MSLQPSDMLYSWDDNFYYVLSEKVFGAISTDVREKVSDELEFATDEGRLRAWNIESAVEDPAHGLDKFLNASEAG